MSGKAPGRQDPRGCERGAVLEEQRTEQDSPGQTTQQERRQNSTRSAPGDKAHCSPLPRPEEPEGRMMCCAPASLTTRPLPGEVVLFMRQREGPFAGSGTHPPLCSPPTLSSSFRLPQHDQRLLSTNHEALEKKSNNLTGELGVKIAKRETAKHRGGNSAIPRQGKGDRGCW